MNSTQEPGISTGAKPIDAPDAPPEVAALSVQGMFDAIAPRYDVLNHVLSAGIDFSWWWRTARVLRPILRRPEARIVDICCGTGDMTLALLRHRPSTISTAPILALDFSHQMLSLGKAKYSGKSVLPVEADALHLPLSTGVADLISAAFGFRNLVSYEDGLAELYRVLKPGGEIAILECNQPDGLTAVLYNLYFKKILPRIGGMLSNRTAYTYLPTSVERFPRAPRMLELIRQAGFEQATWTSYTFGIAGLYRAVKPRV
jgi:demethylmenaquinone methyltransferase/2-methoxy-6-polyprenyl-1,4-benzoquinol methylase